MWDSWVSAKIVQPNLIVFDSVHYHDAIHNVKLFLKYTFHNVSSKIFTTFRLLYIYLWMDPVRVKRKAHWQWFDFDIL